MKYYEFNGLRVSEPNNKKRKKAKKTKLKAKTKIKEPMSRKKIINICIGVFLLVFFTISATLYSNHEPTKEFLDKYVFRKDVYENNLPFIVIDSVNAENIYAYGKNIMILHQNSLRVYNKMGVEEYNIDVKIKKPLFASKGNYLCLADKGGNKIYLISGRNIIWQKDLEGSISNICINKNGFIAVSIADTSYKTIVETYDNSGTRLFRQYLSTSNVIDIDISGDNKSLAIAEANFTGAVIQSSVKIISIEEAKKNSTSSIVYSGIANPGDLIVNIEYNNRNNLICMYDGRVDCVKNNQNEEVINFSSEDILFVDIGLNSGIVKVKKKPTGLFSAEAELKIINSNTMENKSIYTIEGIPQKIYTYDTMICINLGTEVLFINGNGWLTKRYRSSQEIKDVVMCDGVAGIIYKDRVEIISL